MRQLTDIKKTGDTELVAQYKQSGNQELVGELYMRYTRFVFLVSMKYLKDAAKSEDAVMQIFEKLLRDLKVHEVHNFKSWLHTVTRNHCLITLRSETTARKHEEIIKKEELEFMESGYEVHPLEKESHENQLQHLEAAIGTLNEEQRECVELFYLQEKSYKEVADETGYTLNQVKSYIQNGKRNLKNFLIETGFVLWFWLCN